MQIYILPQVVT